MKRFYLLFLAIFILAACQENQPEDNTLDDESLLAGVSNKKEEVTIGEIKPRLTVMYEAAKLSLTRREVLNPNLSGVKIEKIVLRSDGDDWPVVMDVHYLDSLTNPKTTYYFHHRKLLAVEKPSGNYIFKNDKLQVWTDENWDPLKNKTAEMWLDQENILLKNAKKFLNTFEIKYEE